MGDFPIGFGRYQLVERLAMGGMAELFVATAPGEHGFQKKVVIKRLLPHLNADATYKAMFIDEAKLTARLVHPKIAQTFELGRVDDALFIAMEHVDGIDVLALLREFAARKRRIQPQLAAWIAHETLDALDYAHNLVGEDGRPMGIVHRDISPSNVLLSVRGHLKLVDFGIARAIDPERAHKSKTGMLKGKYGYMSPEQVLEQGLDARSDVFSVGVVLAELLTGRRLFAAANELDVLLMVRDARLTRLDTYGGDLDPGLDQIVRKALKKPLDDRWQSAAQFRDALGEWLFEHRYRITPQLLADVVAELREAVVTRRTRASSEPAAAGVANGATPVPDPSEGAPAAYLDGGDSMPIVQLFYEPASVEDPPQPSRTISPSELAARAPVELAAQAPGERASAPAQGAPPNKRADTVAARPSAVRVPPLPPRIPTRPATGAAQLGAAAPEAAVEAPMAGTISAVLEAITLPDDLLADTASSDEAVISFDDLEEVHASRSREIIVPTPEELQERPPPPAPPLADIEEPSDDTGEFHVISPLRVLFRLMTARATGLLVVAVGGIKKEIYVRDGHPEYVSSNVASELFGNYLVAKGVLSAGELAMALAMMPHYGGKLGDTLVGLGLLKPLEVFRHLTRQVRSKIIDVCTWNKGSFDWYAGRENAREAFPLDFNAFEILGAGALAMPDDHIESWIGRHGALALRPSHARRIGPERFEVKGLVELYARLDGARTVNDLVEAQPQRAARLQTGRMLCLLEACDLARPG